MRSGANVMSVLSTCWLVGMFDDGLAAARRPNTEIRSFFTFPLQRIIINGAAFSSTVAAAVGGGIPERALPVALQRPLAFQLDTHSGAWVNFFALIMLSRSFIC